MYLIGALDLQYLTCGDKYNVSCCDVKELESISGG